MAVGEANIVPALFQKLNGIGRGGVFDGEGVGHPLVMDAGLVDGLLDVHVEVEDVEDDLQDGVDDGGAAGGADDHVEFAVFGDDGGGHGGERRFVGRDGVGFALEEAEEVGVAGGGGEVVHFIVEQEAEAGGGDAGAEAAVEGVGDGDGVAFGVDDGEVGGFGAFVSGERAGVELCRWGWL